MHDVAPVTMRGSDEVKAEESRLPYDSTVGKWANLWKSLILSSLGKTAYPYCKYVRAMDFSDLKSLLEDSKFRDKYTKSFFSDDLARFYVEAETPTKQRSGRGKAAPKLLADAVVERIGDAITQHTPLVKEITGELSRPALQQWIPRLPKLQQLWLWHGAALLGTGPAIARHSSNFKSLKFYQWLTEDADEGLAALLHELRPDSFEALEIFNLSKLGTAFAAALDAHARSLVELRLGGIDTAFLRALPAREPFAALRTLHGDFSYMVRLGAGSGSNEVGGPLTDAEYSACSAWLCRCINLSDLKITGSLDNPKLLQPILRDPNIRLTSLEVHHYAAAHAREFHFALRCQADSLRSLCLRGDGEGCDAAVLLESLYNLERLAELRLHGVADVFGNSHYVSLSRCMPLLEELMLGGYGINDTIWPAMGNLTLLRRLDVLALSQFSAVGLKDYTHRLGDGNKGLALAVLYADPTAEPLTEEEQAEVRELLAKKVDGKFDYVLARGTGFWNVVRLV